MLNLLAYVRRKSLFTTLFFSILLLAMLSIVSSSTGWYLLDNIRQSQQQLSARTLPLISAAQTMATESAALAFLTPQITRTKNELDLDELYIELYRHLDIMLVTQRRFDGLGLRQSDIQLIQSTVTDIGDNFESLRENISAKFVLRQFAVAEVEALLVKSSELNILVEQKITELSDQSFELSNRIRQGGIGDENQFLDRLININDDSNILFDLNRKLIIIRALLDRLPGADTFKQLRDIKSRIDFQVRSLVSQSVVMFDVVNKKLLSAALSELYQQLNLKVDVEFLQKQLISQNLELMEIDTRVKSNVFDLNNLINDLVEQVEINTLADTSRANQATTLSSNILLAAATLSLLISAIIIWFFVIRRIILPLAEVTDMIRKLSRNRLDIEIKAYDMVELNQISQALEVFRSNSLALNEHKNSLLKSNALLTRANEDLNAFVHVASHDLKTPLRGIRVLSDFIVSDIKEGNAEEAESNVRLIQKRIVRLGQLLDSLLDYTKLNPVSGIELQVDVKRVVHEVFGQLDDADQFSLVMPDELPECNVVESDLVLIFANLFSNAVRHHDLQAGQIMVSFRETEESYVFDVSDDGPGIALEYQQRVFSVLQKLKTKDEVEGSGVGLAHVKRLLEARGGEISVISNPALERGSRFKFYYPKLNINK